MVLVAYLVKEENNLGRGKEDEIKKNSCNKYLSRILLDAPKGAFFMPVIVLKPLLEDCRQGWRRASEP